MWHFSPPNPFRLNKICFKLFIRINRSRTSHFALACSISFIQYITQSTPNRSAVQNNATISVRLTFSVWYVILRTAPRFAYLPFPGSSMETQRAKSYTNIGVLLSYNIGAAAMIPTVPNKQTPR